MNNTFTNLSNYAVCVILRKHIYTDYKILKSCSTHERYNTSLWHEQLKDTYHGQLVTEIINRNITRHYFVIVSNMEKVQVDKIALVV